MTAQRRSHVLARAAITLCAAGAGLLGTDGARAATPDITEPIPATVGAPGGVAFYVNTSAPGLDPVRVESIIRRSLARWGDAVAGTTTNPPGVADGQNVIGVGTLDAATLGLTETRSRVTDTPVAATQTCASSPREPTQTVVRRNRTQRVLLRSDVVSSGRVRRRTLRRRIKVPVFSLTTGPALARVCVNGAATTNQSAAIEVDVTLSADPAGADTWSLTPLPPPPTATTQYDFETNALHELGHVSGLAHQIDPCDPSTPLPVGQAPTEFWRSPAPGEWFRPTSKPCPANPVPPAPIVGGDSVEPLPGAGATALAGTSIQINPRVPAGYDSPRFVAVAARAIQRAGGTVAGVSDVAPSSGDGVSVLGFATLGVKTLTSSRGTPRTQVAQPYKLQSCRRANVRVRKQVVVRGFVRRGLLALRRDSIKTRTRTVKGYRCTTVTKPAVTAPLAPELDLRVNDRTIAWEFGPGFPVNGTRWDLETALLQTAMIAGGLPSGAACDATTPNSLAAASPGDWWRSTAEVRRSRCLSGGANTAQPATRTVRGAVGGTDLQASGYPDDVKPLR